jgi:beta-glucosidase
MVWKKKLLLLLAIMAVLIFSISMAVMGSSSSSSSIGAIRTSEVGRQPAESLDVGSETENMELMYLQRTSPSATTTAESLHRNDFPNGFVFGTSSSSYQFEGAVKEGGRGPSIWDTASHIPGVIADNSTGDVTTDQYHRYKEDVELLVQLGVDAYRFSIAWSRIFPDGKGPIANKEGIAYYNRLIDALLENGIQPYVTLFHFDLPQAFQDSFGGWRSPLIV